MSTLLRLSCLALVSSFVCFAPPDAGGGTGDAGGGAPAPATEKPPVLKQNGIKRPEKGSITGRLWDIADSLSEKQGRPATRKQVVDEYMKVANANSATANTQYARWVAYHGVADVLKSNRKNDTEALRKNKEAEKQKAKDDAAKKKAAKDEAKAKAKAEADAKKAADKKAADEAAKNKAAA